MQITTMVPTLRLAMAREEKRLGQGVYAGMDEAATALKTRLRGEVLAAGMGQRLANTWRSRTYPQRKRDSLNAKGTVWTNAGKIINFFSATKDVVPVNGRKYLAIPAQILRNRGGRGGAQQRLSVQETEQRMGQKLKIIPGRNGNLLGMFDASLDRKGKRRGVGNRKRDLVLYFVFVRMVRSRKIFDVEGVAREIAATIPSRISERLAA